MFTCSVCCAVGNSDGLYKGKRYFKCPPKHGKMVRMPDVLSVLHKVCCTYSTYNSTHMSVHLCKYLTYLCLQDACTYYTHTRCVLFEEGLELQTLLYLPLYFTCTQATEYRSLFTPARTGNSRDMPGNWVSVN